MTPQPTWNPLYESFQWVGDLVPEEREGRFFVKGRAIHPCKTYHPNEWPEVRVYLEEELKASAPTLSDKPLTLDHTITLEAPNKVLKSAWEDGAIEYIAEVSRDIYELVKSAEIKHVSIEYDWKVLEKLNGIAPRGLQLTGLSLLRQMKPGDPTASVQAWEGVVNKLMEIRKTGQQTGASSIEERFNQLEGIVKRLTEQDEEKERLGKEREAAKTELAEAQRKIRDLTEERDSLKTKLSIGEAVVQPGAKPQIPLGYVKSEEILAILPRDVPYRWGAGPHELVRRLRRKCSQST